MRLFHRRLYYGWVVLAAVAGINVANGATAIGVLTVFILPFTEEFHWSRTQISAVTSVGPIVGAMLAPTMGRLTDRLGGVILPLLVKLSKSLALRLAHWRRVWCLISPKATTAPFKPFWS